MIFKRSIESNRIFNCSRMTDRVVRSESDKRQFGGGYPLVQVMDKNCDVLRCDARSLYNDQKNSEHHGMGSSYRACDSRSDSRFGLGVNAQTGRLQWCPDIMCCKFLIILPVLMLPITLVLILMMRLEGMLIAMKIQSGNEMPLTKQQLEQIYLESFDDESFNDGAYENLFNEELVPPINARNERKIADIERLRRCMSFKFGLSETMDLEDRDIMKDARTSFLPYDTTVIPRDCFESFNHYGQLPAQDVITMNRRRRGRRDNPADNMKNPDTDVKTRQEDNASVRYKEFEPIETMSLLKSFWNEEGTKKSIREAQARTMNKYMNNNIDPCTDFYKFACGNWEKHHPIPKDKAGFDTFEMLRENLDVVLRELLETNDYKNSEHLPKEVQQINGNNYESNKNSEADIVHTINKDLAVELQKQKLRRHIVKKRYILSDILMRYRRHTLTFATTMTPIAPTTQKRANIQQDRIRNAATATILRISNIKYDSAPFKTLDFANVIDGDEPTEDAVVKARHLYQSCTNHKLLEDRGIQPLLNLINDLGGWPVLDVNWNPSTFDWLYLTAQLRRYNNDILIVEWVGPDIKNSDENIIQFDQTNLGLPTREYYLQEVNAKYLEAYQRFMSDVMYKLGAPREMALKTAAEVVNFETQLASITAPAETRLNVTKLYKRMPLNQLQIMVPEIDWIRYLNILQNRTVNPGEHIVIYAIDYMKDLVNLLRDTDPQTLSNYLMWRFVRHRINNVDDRFDDTKQKFYHALFGREESPSRWKVCISQVNTNMGMALGSMFVRKYFDENSKKDTLKMTHELQQAFREILKSTDWLDPETKYLAELKVNAMSLKIGYPDFILNPQELNEKYAGINIDPEKYFENTINVLLHTTKTEQNKLGQPVNKTNWQAAPAIVNAYYSRNKNQIMFPAGILQPPFYHRYFPRALNFGGIGVVIGHELTHGFDDKGRLFDLNGSIHKWWSDSAIRGFDERARCIIAQYGNYTVGEVGISLNGESTQGENIADNGGIRQAFHAYQRWLEDNPERRSDEHLPGLNMTGQQLFFLNFGQVWCGAMRPEAVRNKLNTAIHSPGRFRVIGTLSNSKDFAKVFNCPLGSPMNPVHKCSVW